MILFSESTLLLGIIKKLPEIDPNQLFWGKGPSNFAYFWGHIFRCVRAPQDSSKSLTDLQTLSHIWNSLTIPPSCLNTWKTKNEIWKTKNKKRKMKNKKWKTKMKNKK